jgi:hypothetical protein
MLQPPAASEEQRNRQIDQPFYRERIRPLLPDCVLDFHAHIWRRRDWKAAPREAGGPGSRYMVLDRDFSQEDLAQAARVMLPDNRYEAVCFGYPTPVADLTSGNLYAAQAGREGWVYPLLITGRGLHSVQELEQKLRVEGFYGYKVYLPWEGDDYRGIRVEDMIGPGEMQLAERYRLIVLLHVPGAGRLADPRVQEAVRELSRSYPHAQLVLAHCGRCYLPEEMGQAAASVADLPNVYLDTAMVMDPTVIQIALEAIDSSRLLFASDLPVARMRGRRVYVMDHWVDLVLPGNPESAYRVQSENFRASFMLYEIILAVVRAAERAGLSAEQTRDVFYRNGKALLQRVERPTL